MQLDALWLIVSPFVWFLKLAYKTSKQLCIGAPYHNTNLNLLFQQRFADGQVFTDDVFGTMLARVFRFPAMIEFAEALTMPNIRRQPVFVWQVHCPPEFLARTFGELVNSWLEP